MEVFASALEREASRYKFDATKYQYTNRGRAVSWQRVRLASDQYGLRIELELVDLTNRLRDGEITLVEWQKRAMEHLKALHLNSVALSRGGWQQMAPADYGRVGGILTREYRYLQRMATQIAEGRRRLDGHINRRMRLFARAGRSSYLIGLRETLTQRGFDQERSVLSVAEHCEECISEELKGYQPIGKMVPIGSRRCLRNCKCKLYVRRSADNTVLGPF